MTTAKNDASNDLAGTSIVPVVGIDEAEWSALIAFGRMRLGSYAILKFTAVDAAVPVRDDF